MAVTGSKTGIYRCTAAGDAVAGRMKIRYFRWVSATTAGHQCIVKETDSGGDVLFESEADAAHFTDLHYLDRWVEGFYVSTLGSGVLFVYTE